MYFSKTSVALNSVQISDTVIVSTNQTITVTNGTPVVNGIVQSNGVLVSAGSTLAIQAVASGSYFTPVIAYTTVNQQVLYFVVVTQDTPLQIYNPTYANEPPFAFTTSDWVPNRANNRLVKYTISTNSSAEYPVTTATNTPVQAIPYILLTDWFDNSLLRFSTTYQTLQRTVVGTKPYGLTYATSQSGQTIPWITVANDNKVVRLDSQFNVAQSVTTGQQPRAIITDLYNNMWIANYGSSTVTRLVMHPVTLDVSQTHINVGTSPLELAASATHIYVGCQNAIHVIDINTLATTSFSTANPWGLQIAGNRLYCANSSQASISVFELTNNTLLQTIPIGQMPNFLVVHNNRIYCCDQETSLLNVLDLNGQFVTQHQLPDVPYSISVMDDDTLLISCMYSNTPSRLMARIVDPITQPVFSSVGNTSVSSVIQSNVVTIQGNTSALPCRVLPLYDEQFIKNGNPVGTTTTVSSGDIIRVSITSASSNDTARSVLIVIGNHVQEWQVTTAVQNYIPLPITFESVSNAVLGSTNNSNSVLIDGTSVGLTLFTQITNGQLVVNTIPVGLSDTIEKLDLVQARVIAASNYATTTVALIDMGLFDAPYVVQTIQDPNLRLMDHTTKNLIPTDFTAPYAGSITRSFIKTDITTLTTSELSIVIPETNPADFNNQLDYLMVCDYLGNQLIRTKLDGAAVQAITITKPYDSTISPFLSNNPDQPTLIFCTSHDTDTVQVIDHATWTVLHSINVGARPCGIVGSTQAYRFAVCCHTGQKVQIWDYTPVTNATALVHTIQFLSGYKPLHIVLDPTGTYYWVTIESTSKLARITVSTNAVTYYDTQSTPWDLCCTELDVFVACAYANVVQQFRAGSVIHTYSITGGIPIACTTYEYLGITYLAVTNFDGTTNAVEIFDTTTYTKIHSVDTTQDRLLYGSTVVSNVLYTYRQYSDAPTRSVPPVMAPTAASLTNVLNAVPGSTVVSETINVVGLTRDDAPVQIPALFTGKIFVNGQDMGTSTTVKNGDTLYCSLVCLGHKYYRHNLPLIFNGLIIDWYVQTEPDLIADPLVFLPISNLIIDTVAYSNIVTITGMTLDYLVPAIISAGTGVVHNGQDVTNPDTTQPTVIQVEALDTIQLYGVATRPYGSTKNHTITISGITSVFTLRSQILTVFRVPYTWFDFYETQYIPDEYYPIQASTEFDQYSHTCYYLANTYDHDHKLYALSQIYPDHDHFTYALDITIPTHDRFTYAFDNTVSTIDHLTYASNTVSYTKDTITLRLYSLPLGTYYSSQKFLADVDYIVNEPTIIALSLTNYGVIQQRHWTQLVTYSMFPMNELITISSNNYWAKFEHEPETVSTSSWYNRYRYKQVNEQQQYVQYAIDARGIVFQVWKTFPAYDFILNGLVFVKNYLYHQISQEQEYDLYHWAHYWINQEVTKYSHDYWTEDAVYYQEPESWWPVQLFAQPNERTVRFTGISSVQYKHTFELIDYYTRSKDRVTKPVTPMVNNQLQHLFSATYQTPVSNHNQRATNATTPVPSGLRVAHVRNPTHTIRDASILNLHTIADFSGLNATSVTDPWYDNTELYSCVDKHYYTDQAQAEAAAVGSGLQLEDVITVQIRPGCWVWAHTVSFNPDACENLQAVRVKGWIRGG